MAIHTPSSHIPFVRLARRIYHPLGFQKGYNFLLYFIFAGAFLGFCLARLPYLSITHYYASHAGPGEPYWFHQDWYRIGITLHLSCVLPAGILAVLQSLPIIRHKALLFHRMNGYAALLLLFVGTIGAFMIARRSFGGDIAIQSIVGLMGIMVVTSASLAYYNIKRLQIDQHRAWMLRCWVYCGAIVTARLLLVMIAPILSRVGSYFAVFPCEQIVFTAGQEVAESYQTCVVDPAGLAVVHADFLGPKSVMEVAAAFDISFGAAAWLALAIHAIAVEVYLHLTPAEKERLRNVSYERQLERGLVPVGSAGLTVDRFGDCEEWKPRAKTILVQRVGTGDDEQKPAGLTEQTRSASLSDVSKPPSVLGWDR